MGKILGIMRKKKLPQAETESVFCFAYSSFYFCAQKIRPRQFFCIIQQR